jgi:8-oxo-dGTP pyrophosphatase MutT (NUDIX family)/phosphohistidine phosphatase SixA
VGVTEPDLIVAAGAVVVRKGPEVLLVHRPKYDDWSFPKGKLDPGEHITTAAVREVAEETGLDVRLGPRLSSQAYRVRNGSVRPKVVHYWLARVVHDDDVSAYRPNAEIDAVTWVPLDKAAETLTYSRDRETLAEAAAIRKKSHPLVVLRHGKASPRKQWTGDDRKRPLAAEGELQAETVVPVLAAYGVERVLSSSSKRCWTTVSPYADVADLEVEVTAELSEEDATPESVERIVHELLLRREPVVLCTHRPVLPHVYQALGVRDPKLDPGSMLVVHHRRGQVVGLELHQA